MKRLLFFSALLLAAACAASAQRHDNNWVKGLPDRFFDSAYVGTRIYFDSGRIAQERVFDLPVYIWEPSIAMSDANGELQFSSNGCVALDKHHQLMENGDSLWYPSQHTVDFLCSHGADYDVIHHGAMALPKPGHDSVYCIFSVHLDTLTIFQNYFTTLLFHEIDMRPNGGLGRVTLKHQILLRDTLHDQMAAVRHGNGRDWWIVVSRLRSDTMYAILLDPDGPHGPFVRRTPIEWIGKNVQFLRTASCFSPDGTLFCRHNFANDAHLYRFDRCTGEFSNPIKIEIEQDVSVGTGASFSPNGRLLYLSTTRRLYQYDLLADDIPGSQMLIDTFDGHKEPYFTNFYQHHPAPDGKTYLTASNGMQYLHVIDRPNERGKACHFVQRGHKLLIVNSFSLPFYPNFRLYDLPGSPCDTLGIDSGPGATVVRRWIRPDELKIVPNPTNGSAELVLPEGSAAERLWIWTATGALIDDRPDLSAALRPTIDASFWAAGVYFVAVRLKNGQEIVKKLIVTR